MFEKVKHLYTRVVRTQYHLNLIKEDIQSWGNYPMYARKEIPQGFKNLLNIQERSVTMAYRQVNCERTKKMRDRFIYINLMLFSNADLESEETESVEQRGTKRRSSKAETQIFDEQQEAPKTETQTKAHSPEDLKELLETYPSDYQNLFRDYMKYVDSVIGEELAGAIYISTTYIKKEINSRAEENAAVFEIVMELQEPNIAYFPHIDINHKLSLYAKVNEILSDIYIIMKWIPRLVGKASDGDLAYDGELFDYTLSLSNICFQNLLVSEETAENLAEIKSEILNKVRYGLSIVKTYCEKYRQYEHLWLTDRQEYVKEIKTYGRPLTDMEKKGFDTENIKTLKDPNNPPLDVYRSEVSF